MWTYGCLFWMLSYIIGFHYPVAFANIKCFSFILLRKWNVFMVIFESIINKPFRLVWFLNYGNELTNCLRNTCRVTDYSKYPATSLKSCEAAGSGLQNKFCNKIWKMCINKTIWWSISRNIAINIHKIILKSAELQFFKSKYIIWLHCIDCKYPKKN